LRYGNRLTSPGLGRLVHPRRTQGDWVLRREMAPNKPEIAQQIALEPPTSDSSTSDSDYDEENSIEDSLARAARVHERVQSGTQVPQLNFARAQRIGTAKNGRKVYDCHCGRVCYMTEY
jgi:hypothetical protein